MKRLPSTDMSSPADIPSLSPESLNDDDMFAQNLDVRSARHIDGITIRHPTTGVYYALSGTAAYIWDCLGSPNSLSYVKKAAADRYDVAPQEIGTQINEFVAELAAYGLIAFADHSTKEES